MTKPQLPDQTKQETLRWIGGGNDGYLILIDQTCLPVDVVEIECRDVETVWEAIRMLRVRGAPAIGIAAAYGICLAMQSAKEGHQKDLLAKLDEAANYLANSRPTAVNLFWALDRMKHRAASLPDSSSREQLNAALLDEASTIHEEDRIVCRAIGRCGADLIRDGDGILTHCNAGGLATSEYGTALSVIFTAQDDGKEVSAFVDETRPLLQGSRLTAWELSQRGIDTTLICDSMAAQVMREGKIQVVITGADRVAANGDAANKIGTYSIAQLAKAHDIPFYIASPVSTFDLKLESGAQIPIEQRRAEEVTEGFGRRTAPEGVHVYNPAFDVTPAGLIRGIITERGIIQPVSTQTIRDFFSRIGSGE